MKDCCFIDRTDQQKEEKIRIVCTGLTTLRYFFFLCRLSLSSMTDDHDRQEKKTKTKEHYFDGILE